MRDLNVEAERVHKANQKWWVSLETGEPIERNFGELFMLIVSELAEAMEGHRKDLMDDKLPHRKMAEVELADALIRVLDVSGFECPGQLQEMDGEMWSENFAENLLNITRTVAHAESVRSPRHFSYMIGDIISLAQHCGYDIWGAYEEKMAYNATRADHTREGRLAEGGKKY